MIATSRNPARFGVLRRAGADHTIRDDDAIVDAVRGIVPEGVDAALEFVGATALPTTLSITRPEGTVCFVGALNGDWTVADFSPFTIPNGVHLTNYSGDSRDLPAHALNDYLRAIEAGTMNVIIAGTYRGLDKVADAHRDLENGRTPGKHVVILDGE